MMEKHIDLKAAFHDSFQGWSHRQKSRDCSRSAPRGRCTGGTAEGAPPARPRQRGSHGHSRALDPRRAEWKSGFQLLPHRAQLQKTRTKPYTAWLSATQKLVLPPQQNSRAMLTSGVNLEVNKNFPRAETK